MTNQKLQAYQQFLANKVEVGSEQGLCIEPTDLRAELREDAERLNRERVRP